MTTTVTGTIKDVTGQPDNSAWVFYSVLREGDASDVVTSKWVRAVPVAGALSVDLESGFCIVNAPNGQVYNITVPDSGTPDIWDLLAAAVAFPPGTSAEDVATAVQAYLTANPPTGLAAFYANLAAFPGTGTAGTEYVAEDTGKIFRWNGSAYTEISAGQPVDSDLTAIAAITHSDNDVIQAKAGGWTNRTPAQLKTDLALAKGDVGLGNVDNTSDVNKPVSTAQAAAISVLRPSKNTVVAIGDSQTAWGTSPNGYTAADNYITHLCIESDQRMQLTGIFATSGYTLSQIQSTHLPSVLAMSPLPAACVVFGGTNDLTSGSGITFSTMQTTLKAIVASLVAVGIVPILVTLPPREDNTTSNQNTVAWNVWLLRYAAQHGFGVIDAYAALVAADGTCITAYQYDTIHPNYAGHRAIAQQAIRDGLPQLFPPIAAGRTSKSTADLTNMFNSGSVTYGLHTVDTNSDGIADGWASSGVGTFAKALVAPTAADGLQGNWQQMSRTTADNASGASALLVATINTALWSVGDTLAFSAKVQTSGIESTATPWDLRVNCFQTSANNYRGPTVMQADYDGLVYVEFVIPTGTTGVFLQSLLETVTNAGTAALRFGEVTLRNLTTGGDLV